MPSHLILVHGLWMRGITMTVLQRRLADAGYAVETFDYASVVGPLDDTLARLRDRMRAHRDGVHLVGHSLGGLLALLACRDDAGLPPGRIVCMGSPLAGSAAARQLGAYHATWLMGSSRDVLEQGLARWDGPREVGMVAGSMGVGLGAVIGHLQGENDGTVALAETRLAGLADHCIVATTHTGMLLSRAAADQVIAFLRTGHFHHDPPPPP